jgi:hypothetical protein
MERDLAFIQETPNDGREPVRQSHPSTRVGMALSLHIDFLSGGVPLLHGDQVNRDRQRLLG